MKFSLLAALKVVKMTIFSVVSGENFVQNDDIFVSVNDWNVFIFKAFGFAVDYPALSTAFTAVGLGLCTNLVLEQIQK